MSLGGIKQGLLAPELIVMHEITAEETGKATLVTCAAAEDAEEATMFLKMLGLL